MGLFYKVTPKKLLEIRNEIFVKYGIPALEKNGFASTPFNGKWFGKIDPSVYIYEMCRLDSDCNLEILTTYISRGDRWIKLYLNIFSLEPKLKHINELRGKEKIQFYRLPNDLTKMRLRIDGCNNLPFLRTFEHKIKSFYTESGFKRRVDELSKLIENDLINIDSFIKKWHDLHQPMITDWDGKKIE